MRGEARRGAHARERVGTRCTTRPRCIDPTIDYAHTLYRFIKLNGGLFLTVSVFCYILILASNIFRFIHVAYEYGYTYGYIDARVQLFLIYITWPLSNLCLLLIALYWEELLSKSLGSDIKAFVSKYKGIYIGIVIGLNVLNMAVVIYEAAQQDPVSFATAIKLNRYFYIVVISLSLLYSIINIFRIKYVLDKAKGSEKTSISRLSIFIFGANLGSVLLLITICLLLYTSSFQLSTQNFKFLSLVGVLITDTMVLFAFKSKSMDSSSARSRSKNTKSKRSKN